MKQLGFRIERIAWPEASGMAESPPCAVKIREDGRQGPAVADEALLWDALQEELAENAKLIEENESLHRQLDKRGVKK